MYEGEIVVHKTTYEKLPAKISPVFKTGKSHEDSIAEAINSELDWLTIDQCGYAADSVISSVTLLNLEIK